MIKIILSYIDFDFMLKIPIDHEKNSKMNKIIKIQKKTPTKVTNLIQIISI